MLTGNDQAPGGERHAAPLDGIRVLELGSAIAGPYVAELLYLLSNKKSAPAIHLYEKLGFRHDDEIMRDYGARYARCDVAMRYVGTAGSRLTALASG